MASDEFEGVSIDDLEKDRPQGLPSTLSSYTPIVIPIVLIGTQSVVSLLFEEGHFLRTLFLYLGWPVVALSIGVWLAYRNIKSKDAIYCWTKKYENNNIRIIKLKKSLKSLKRNLKSSQR
jgi:H+/gluconate symporter-like permease